MSVDYEAVVAELESKRNAFNAWVDNAINGIRQVQAMMAGLPMPSSAGLSQAAIGPSPGIAAIMVTPDVFFGLGLAEASIKYLQLVKKQQTTREISEALEAAHYHHTSANFMNTVNTALYRRERVEGDIVRIGRQWALSEWYPGRRRAKRDAHPEAENVQVPDSTDDLDGRPEDEL